MATIKVKTLLVDKDFQLVDGEVKIQVMDYDEKTKEIYYKTSIPDHIFDFLKDTGPDYTEHKFKKNLKSISISHLLETITNLSYEISSRLELNTQTRLKKIFVKFNHNNAHTRCEWTGGYMGQKTTSAFNFFIGYEITESKNNIRMPDEEDVRIKNYYTLICLQAMSSTSSVQRGSDTGFKEGMRLHPFYMKHERDAFLRDYAILDWSQEAEDYLTNIQNKFKELNEHLALYLSNMTNESLKQLMENSNTLKLLK